MDSSTTTSTPATEERCRLSCDFELLRHSPVFAGLNLEVIKLFAYLATRRTYRPGDYVVKQDETARQAFIIVRGNAEIRVTHRGREILLQEIRKNSFFGELALLAQFKWFFSARAVDELEVLVIERTAFQKVIEKYPEQRDRLIERMVQLRVGRLAEQTGEMLDRLTSAPESTSHAAV